jgi:hypothetical protein
MYIPIIPSLLSTCLKHIETNAEANSKTNLEADMEGKTKAGGRSKLRVI